MKKNTTQSMVMTGVFTAILAILSILEIPMPSGVPITLQTFAVALCGYVLGWKMGAVSAFIYLLLGTIGVPVFSGMTAGPRVLFGLTGGFIWGFIFLAAFCGMGIVKKNRILSALLGFMGLVICHCLGILQFSLVSHTGILESAVLVSLPYLVKDVLSVVGAMMVAIVLRKRLAQAQVGIHEQTA